MTLQEYIKSFPRRERMTIRKWLASQLGISEVYVRSMCNGTKAIPAKFALPIEKLTNNAVPRHVTACTWACCINSCEYSHLTL